MDGPCVTNQITNWLTISQGLKSNNRITWNLAWGVRIAQNCLNREYTIYIYMLWTHHDEFHCCSQILWHQVILLLSVPEAWHNLSSLHSLKRQYTLVEDFFPFLWPVGLTIYWYCKRKDCCCCVTNSSQIYSRECKNSFTNFPWDRSYYNQVKKTTPIFAIYFKSCNHPVNLGNFLWQNSSLFCDMPNKFKLDPKNSPQLSSSNDQRTPNDATWRY